jgi:hypothetical protein
MGNHQLSGPFLMLYILIVFWCWSAEHHVGLVFSIDGILLNGARGHQGE